jgi:hypothetical protein
VTEGTARGFDLAAEVSRGHSSPATDDLIVMLRFGFFRNSRAGLAAPNDPKT